MPQDLDLIGDHLGDEVISLSARGVVFDDSSVEDDVRGPRSGRGEHPTEGRLRRTRRRDSINGEDHLGEQGWFLRPKTSELLGRDTGEAVAAPLSGGDIGQEEWGPQTAAVPISMTPGAHE